MGNACPARKSLDGPLSEKITMQTVKERGYVVLFNKVYNLKDYVRKHPGGQDILLSVFGRDATVEFETMRHSPQALDQVSHLLIGSFNVASTEDGSAEIPSAKKLSLTGGRPNSRPDVAGSKWWSVDVRGFLPSMDPVKTLPPPWDAVISLCDVLPSVTIQRSWTHVVLDLPSTMDDVNEALEELTEGELECLHSALGYVCLAYVHSVVDVYEKNVAFNIVGTSEEITKLPDWLAAPYLGVSRRLDRQPMLDYAGCVLNNWERLDPKGPIKPSNVRLLRRFTGLIDEEWFFKTHIIIESEGGHVAGALKSISAAMRNNDLHNLLQELHLLEEALWRLASVCLPIMFARSPHDHKLLCEPFMFFFRLRPYITSVTMEMCGQRYSLSGPSGAMSTILPAVDALLGIRNTSAELREAVKTFEGYVPKEHRQFLDGLRNAPSSVRSFIKAGKATLEESMWYALAGAYNACISRVLDFRWRHWSFVEQFIIRPSTATGPMNTSICPVAVSADSSIDSPSSSHSPMMGTGGTTFDYLQQHISDSQVARITLGPKGEAHTRQESAEASISAKHANLPVFGDVTNGHFWDPTGPNGFVTNRCGNLPGWGPGFVGPLPGCSALMELAAIIPNLCFSHIYSEDPDSPAIDHPFVLRCNAKRAELTALVSRSGGEPAPVARLRFADLEHTWMLLCNVSSAYRAIEIPGSLQEMSGEKCPVTARSGTCPVQPKRAKTEDWLESIVRQVASIVGRPWNGTPEYAELVLNNWYVSPNDITSEDELFVINRQTIQQVHPVCRFLALPDEEWHRKLHILLEAEGGRAVAAAYRSLRAALPARDNDGVGAALNQLAADIDSLTEFQRDQFNQKDCRGEALMISRLRKYSYPDLQMEELAVWIYTEGSSPLLPALHAILGLRKLDGISGPLQEHWQSQGRLCMAESHRQFLDCLESGMSVRAYCLQVWRYLPVETIAALEDAFNNCIEALLRYCSVRQRFVSRVLPRVGHIQTLSAKQENVIRAGRLALLQMRRVADAQRMQLANEAMTGLLPT
mmetsp:Transcript_106953/g.255238  ORF Transcript_106953/g.255238 Transcript_106953/m.255238 type:complete len:1036 (-) Transcript_106953:117-3224(-)|eukprot:CAMPEP_0181401732 /NCGR_PEP_ID=MMETSP1110-20121109/2801_1 /TAXON_ID=174948 /ORGANISM="Symbiodinium sp., Strain CCMP421" /LENGTH=1035 /DNA_ID=CAMNT_0023523909 /DNA_START=41 /DNA_END=3148 /DNA_ORIENTATION=-